jgi:uncharacterized protein
MSHPAFDPRHLNVAAFAAAGARLAGEWPLQGMPRLLADADAAADTAARWSAQGEVRARAGTAGEPWLKLEVLAELIVQCQRCLQPMAQPLQVASTLRFVAGEDKAARLDEDSEEDVLALSATLDLHALVEDELIMTLPFCPRHAHCEPPAA